MLDRETKARIIDYFTGTELVDYLQIPTEDIVEIFEEEIEDNLDEIEEFIGLRKEDEEAEEED